MPMEFETVETYMTFDEAGRHLGNLPRTRNDAHKLIEECMLLANVAAAEYALQHDVPMLYRIHEPPEFSRIQKYATLSNCWVYRSQNSRLRKTTKPRLMQPKTVLMPQVSMPCCYVQ